MVAQMSLGETVHLSTQNKPFCLSISIYLSISTASPPLGDYVQVRVSAVLVEEMLLKIKSSHKIC